MSTVPARWNMTIYRDRDFTEPFAFKDSSGNAMDLTGYTVKAQLRAGRSQSSTLITDFTVTMPTPSSGEISLDLTDTQTSSIGSYTKGFYDILLISPSSFDETYVIGQVTIIDTVTANA